MEGGASQLEPNRLLIHIIYPDIPTRFCVVAQCGGINTETPNGRIWFYGDTLNIKTVDIGLAHVFGITAKQDLTSEEGWTCISSHSAHYAFAAQ